MPKYVVTTTAQAYWTIVVEADSKEEAQDLVLDGDYNPEYDIPDDFQNEEICDIVEMD